MNRLLLTGLLLLAACRESAEELVDDSPVALRVMTFNIEWGGENISFDMVIEAIRLSGADVVGVQEAQGNLKKIADELGWYYKQRSYVISRFPLYEPAGAEGRFVYVEVKPGKAVAIANVHLPSDPYGPDALRDGADVIEVLAIEESARLPGILPLIESLAPLVEQEIPVFVTGDFNAPAHTDWTEEAVGTRPFLTVPMNWPVSLVMAKAGYHDAWRTVYPDPVKHPGLTWWAGRPPLKLYAPGQNDPQDRIDFIWFNGTTGVDEVELVGELGFPDVSLSVDPWPSDHRAVVGQFRVWPANMPAFVDTDRRVYQAGEHVDVRFHPPNDDGWYISVWHQGDTQELLEKRINNGSGHSVFAAGLFEAGRYRAELSNGIDPVSLYSDFWVLKNDANPEVEVGALVYAQGDGIRVSWRNAPGFRNDYVAVYPADTAAGYGNSLIWAYTGSLPHGELVLDGNSSESGWPLAPGAYKVLLMKDDGYESMAESVGFKVVR